LLFINFAVNMTKIIHVSMTIFKQKIYLWKVLNEKILLLGLNITKSKFFSFLCIHINWFYFISL
jgi:hypothetical protein